MNILIINRKGGVGKTTVADELLFSLERSNTDVAFVNLDTQDSAIHADTSDLAETSEVVIIDTPGELSADTKQWIEDADVIVIPTGVNGKDLTSFLATLELAQEYGNGVPIIVVVNRFNRYRAASDFLSALKKKKDEGTVIVTLPQSEAFNTADSMRASVITVSPKSNAAVLTLEMVNEIRNAAQIGVDPVDPKPIREYLVRQAENARNRRQS